MNPFSPELVIAKKIVQHALDRSLQQKDNTEFLIRIKEDLIAISRRGLAALNDEMFDRPLVLSDGVIIIPSPRSILEYELLEHVASLDQQQVVLEGINESIISLDSCIRQHNKNYDYKFQEFRERQRTKRSKNNSASSSSNV
jgi:hypothetical protein